MYFPDQFHHFPFSVSGARQHALARTEDSSQYLCSTSCQCANNFSSQTSPNWGPCDRTVFVANQDYPKAACSTPTPFSSQRQQCTASHPLCSNQDFNILFLFSFLLSLSTRFLCIVSANFSYRAFSSFLSRFSLIAAILFCAKYQQNPSA